MKTKCTWEIHILVIHMTHYITHIPGDILVVLSQIPYFTYIIYLLICVCMLDLTIIGRGCWTLSLCWWICQLLHINFAWLCTHRCLFFLSLPTSFSLNIHMDTYIYNFLRWILGTFTFEMILSFWAIWTLITLISMLNGTFIFKCFLFHTNINILL